MSKRQQKTTKPLPKDSASTGPNRPASERQFVKGLAIRGEAAKSAEGKLPSGATHEIIEENEQGELTVKRRRLSAF